MGDDGVGFAAVERLSARPLPAGVEVIDGGTGGLTLLGLMEGADVVILVDAVSAGRPPGSVLRLGTGDITTEGFALTLHAAGLSGVLTLGREMGLLPPRVILFGVEPETIAPQVGLSPAVEGALNLLLEAIMEEISALYPQPKLEPHCVPLPGDMA